MANYCSKIFIIISLALVVAACEITLPRTIDVNEEEVLARYKDVPLKDVMNDVQKKFKKAKDDEIFFYSPNNYGIARAGLQTARAYFRNPDKRTNVLKALYKADKALDDAYEVKVIVAKEMDEHIKLRDFLLNVDAKKSHTREYRSLITSLMSIVESIENQKEKIINNPEKKKRLDERKKDMMDSLLEFRLRVVKFKYLSYGEQLIAEADSYNARDNAPTTYSRVINARDSAVKYVSENVENLEGVEDIARNFQYEAQRLLHIARAVDTVMKLEKNAIEQYVLKHEENYMKIADALKEPQLKYFSFAAQANKYATSIKRIVKEKQDNALTIAELRSGGGDTSVSADQQSLEASSNVDNTGDQSTENQDNENKGLEVVPISSGGDPEQLKRSLRVLTDQVYQLTIEKNAWQGERAKLQAEIKQLKSAKTAKPKQKAKPKKKADTKPDTKEKVKPKAEAKKEPAKKQDSNNLTARERAYGESKKSKKEDAKPEEKPAESKTPGEAVQTQ